jgi:drug/metabolite transporter (DMT)-like permease
VERHTGLLLIAIALAAYGSYHALNAIAMLPVPASPLLWVAFALQAVLAILAAVGVWRHQRWAAAALLLLGAVIAATALVEGFVGIVAWLYALLIAIAAIVIAILVGAYVNRSGPLLERGRGSPPA